MIIEIAALGVSVVAVILQQLESRKNEAREPLKNFHAGLLHLHQLLSAWAVRADATNRAIHAWVQDGMPRHGKTVDYVVSTQASQASGADYVSAELNPQNEESEKQLFRTQFPPRSELTDLLAVYAPDLAGRFLVAVTQRDDDLTTMFRQMRNLQSIPHGDHAIVEYLGELDKSAAAIRQAADTLGDYIRVTFPPR